MCQKDGNEQNQMEAAEMMEIKVEKPQLMVFGASYKHPEVGVEPGNVVEQVHRNRKPGDVGSISQMRNKQMIWGYFLGNKPDEEDNTKIRSYFAFDVSLHNSVVGLLPK